MAKVVISSCRLHSKKCYFTSSMFSAFYSSQVQHAPKTHKVVNVAIIGSPNSGKSTLINRLTERKICAASNKVHTTMKLVRAMCYENGIQIVFLDTPGIVSDKEQNKYNLPQAMMGACRNSLLCADVIGVVHDVSNRYTRDKLHPNVLEMLNMNKVIPRFLILNKVDKLQQKKQILHLINNLTNGLIAGKELPGVKKTKKLEASVKDEPLGYSEFSDVFIVSALSGDGVSDIKNYLLSNAKEADLVYPETQHTDQSPENIIEMIVRAKFMDFLAQEIPYKLKTQLEYFEEKLDDNKIICIVSVECPTERILRLVNGAGGGRLDQIKSHVRNDLIEAFNKTVHIEITLRVKPGAA